MPAVIGLFSVLFLALAAALAVSLLGIRSRALSALSGALMAAFPAVGYTFLYLFTASAYCFAIFWRSSPSPWPEGAGGTGWQAVCSWPAPWAPIRPM